MSPENYRRPTTGKKVRKISLIGTLLCAAWACAGCNAGSNGPSEDEVKSAYADWNIDFDTRAATNFGNSPPSDDDKEQDRRNAEAKRINKCSAVSQGFYVCDVEGENTLWQLQRFNGTWKIVGFVNRPG